LKKISVWALIVASGLVCIGARSAIAQTVAPPDSMVQQGAGISAMSSEQPLADARTAPELAVRAFTATGARLTDIEVHDWSTVSQRFASMRALTSLALRAAQLLGLLRAHFWQRETRGERVVQLTGSFRGTAGGPTLSLSIEAASMRFVGSPAQTVVALRIYGATHDVSSLAVAYKAMAQAVAEAVAEAGGTADLNATLIGRLPYAYSTTAQQALQSKAWSAVTGRIMQRFTGTYTTSDAGYAPWQVPAVVSGAQKLDLQVAFHRNNYAQMTKVLVGTPMITVEY
jgi:hypothetical protein